VKERAAIRAIFCALALVGSASVRSGDVSTSNPLSQSTLLETVEGLDTRLFDAYNRCDLETLASYVAEDLEFYHDQTGLSRGRQVFLDAIRNNICGKVHRDLLPGTLEAYPLNGYGAVEIGAHLFCDSRKKPKCDREKDGIARFVMLWQNQAGTWKLTRVISYNHIAGGQRPTGNR
jgi:ketosteroid isomerase-like protein